MSGCRDNSDGNHSQDFLEIVENVLISTKI